MKKIKNIGNLLGLAVMFVFAANSVWAQGGTGRITPTTRSATKTTTTKKPVVKKPVVKKPTVTSTTTTRRTTTKKPVGTAKTYDYYFSQGLTALDNQDYQKAVTNFTAAIRLNTQSADAYFNRGLAYLNTGDYEAAIADYTKSIQYNPAADAYYNRGLSYEYNGNYQLAADDYRAAVRIEPGDEEYQNNLDRVESEYDLNGDYYGELGDDFYDKNDFDNALLNYNKAIQLNPRDARVYVRRGFIYHYTGEVAKAYEDYETAIGLDSALNNEDYIKCVNFDSGSDDPNPGIRACTSTINEFPGFGLAYFIRGEIYYNSENDTSALQDFNKSIALYPDFADSYVYRGLIYSLTDRDNLAITEFTKAIQLFGENNPNAYSAYNERGISYERLGNLKQAASDYGKAYQLNPNFTTAKENYDRVIQKQP